MAWNEPGGSNNGPKKDPWGGNDQGPPDLDEVIRKLQDRFAGFFGGKGGGKGNGSRPSGGGRGGGIGVGLIAVVGLIIWAATGIYVVDPAERGVVLRFGQHVGTTLPGPHWHWPSPIERVELVDVDRVRTISRKAPMLTRDENIVNVELAVQYRVKVAEDFLFNVRDPESTLKDVTESAIRAVVGKTSMDTILTEGRAELVTKTGTLIQTILDDYQTGLVVTKVNLQDAQPPEEVQDAFADAIKAREDEQRLKNEAEAYSNKVVNNAKGVASRYIEEAEAYKAEQVAHAEGRAGRFEKQLTAYQVAPQITRDRLYLDAMESVLSKSSKVMLDAKGGNNLMYLPLDKLMQRGSGSARTMSDDTLAPSQPVRNTSRSREPRRRVVQRGRESGR